MRKVGDRPGGIGSAVNEGVERCVRHSKRILASPEHCFPTNNGLKIPLNLWLAGVICTEDIIVNTSP